MNVKLVLVVVGVLALPAILGLVINWFGSNVFYDGKFIDILDKPRYFESTGQTFTSLSDPAYKAYTMFSDSLASVLPLGLLLIIGMNVQLLVLAWAFSLTNFTIISLGLYPQATSLVFFSILYLLLKEQQDYLKSPPSFKCKDGNLFPYVILALCFLGFFAHSFFIVPALLIFLSIKIENQHLIVKPLKQGEEWFGFVLCFIALLAWIFIRPETLMLPDILFLFFQGAASLFWFAQIALAVHACNQIKSYGNSERTFVYLTCLVSIFALIFGMGHVLDFFRVLFFVELLAYCCFAYELTYNKVEWTPKLVKIVFVYLFIGVLRIVGLFAISVSHLPTP